MSLYITIFSIGCIWKNVGNTRLSQVCNCPRRHHPFSQRQHQRLVDNNCCQLFLDKAVMYMMKLLIEFFYSIRHMTALKSTFADIQVNPDEEIKGINTPQLLIGQVYTYTPSLIPGRRTPSTPSFFHFLLLKRMRNQWLVQVNLPRIKKKQIDAVISREKEWRGRWKRKRKCWRRKM